MKMTKTDAQYLERLKKAITDVTGYPYEEIIAKSRKNEIVVMRFILCYLLK